MPNQFDQYTPTQYVPQYVPMPVQEFGQAVTKLQDRYDFARDRWNEMDVFADNLKETLTEGDRWVADDIRKGLDEGMAGIVDSGRFLDSEYLIPQLYKDYIGKNEDLRKSQQSFAEIEKQRALAENMSAQGISYYDFKSPKGWKTVQVDPETGEKSYNIYRHNTEAAKPHVEIAKNIMANLKPDQIQGAFSNPNGGFYEESVTSGGIKSKKVNKVAREMVDGFKSADDQFVKVMAHEAGVDVAYLSGKEAEEKLVKHYNAQGLDGQAVVDQQVFEFIRKNNQDRIYNVVGISSRQSAEYLAAKAKGSGSDYDPSKNHLQVVDSNKKITIYDIQGKSEKMGQIQSQIEANNKLMKDGDPTTLAYKAYKLQNESLQKDYDLLSKSVENIGLTYGLDDNIRKTLSSDIFHGAKAIKNLKTGGVRVLLPDKPISAEQKKIVSDKLINGIMLKKDFDELNLEGVIDKPDAKGLYKVAYARYWKNISKAQKRNAELMNAEQNVELIEMDQHKVLGPQLKNKLDNIIMGLETGYDEYGLTTSQTNDNSLGEFIAKGKDKNFVMKLNLTSLHDENGKLIYAISGYDRDNPNDLYETRYITFDGVNNRSWELSVAQEMMKTSAMNMNAGYMPEANNRVFDVASEIATYHTGNLGSQIQKLNTNTWTSGSDNKDIPVKFGNLEIAFIKQEGDSENNVVKGLYTAVARVPGGEYDVLTDAEGKELKNMYTPFDILELLQQDYYTQYFGK